MLCFPKLSTTFFALLACLAVELPIAFAQQAELPAIPAAVGSTNSGVVRRILPNGLRVLALRKPGARLVAIDWRVRVGGSHETAATAGVAHLIEHMVFKGADAAVFPELSDVGAVDAAMEMLGGELTATTSKDWTMYAATLPKANWTTALAIIGKVLRAPAFRAEDLANEARVIEHEVLVAATDSTRAAIAALYALGYKTDGDASGFSLYGSPAGLNARTPANLRAFHQMHYKPANMTLAVVGDVEPEAVFRAVALLELEPVPLSRSLPVAAAAAPPSLPLPPAFADGLPRRADRDLSTVAVGFVGPKSNEEGGAELVLACDALVSLLETTGDAGGVLYKDMVERRQLALGIEVSYLTRRAGVSTLFIITLTTERGRERAAQNALLDWLRDWEISDANAAVAKRSLLAAAAETGENVGVERLAQRLAFYDAIGANGLRQRQSAIVTGLTTVKLQQTANRLFSQTALAVVQMGDASSETAVPSLSSGTSP